MAAETEQAPNIVVGTAGHVDHGKTELVKALTGINTDRLAEEQERELSIDIGFAHLDLPDGTRLGIVDVPGHERFVKNMLAGASGIDLVMLIVAADEGVMPQTAEHLHIVTLLGIEVGVIVLTKIDLVDEELADLAEEDIRDAVAGTPLADAPVVRTSAKTGEGLEALVDTLGEIASTVEAHDIRGPARLPIDRVFSVPGFGTVVTGTLVRGRLAEGDSVEILPQGYTARVRGLQTHDVFVPEVVAARRVAVNLQRLSGEDVGRGDTLCAPGSMAPGGMLDVRLTLLAGAPHPLKHRTRIRLHHGTAELLGRTFFMDRDQLAPGDSALAQVRLEGLTAASRGDRCVIRSYSPMETIGGAVIVDPAPRRHRRNDADTIARLEALELGDPIDLARQWIAEAGSPIFTPEQLARALQLDQPDAEAMVGDLVDRGEVVRLGTVQQYAQTSAWNALRDSVVAVVGTYHETQPLAPAMPKEALQAAVGRPPAVLLDDVLEKLETAGEVVLDAVGARLADHQVALSTAQERALSAMKGLAQRARFEPPTREAVLRAAGCPEPEARGLLELALSTGDLVPVGEHIYHRATLVEAEQLIEGHVQTNGPVTIADLRNLTGSSRKYMVPLAEHLDGTGFTRRQGDVRIPTRSARR